MKSAIDKLGLVQTTLALAILSITLMGCPPKDVVSTSSGDCQPGYLIAFIRDDGNVQTSYSKDGNDWTNKVVHNTNGSAFGGCSIDYDRQSLTSYLVYFAKTTGAPTLELRSGLGNVWSTDGSDIATHGISGHAEGKPSICQIANREALIAWNNGGAITFAVYRPDAPSSYNKLAVSGPMSTKRMSEIVGSPVLATLGGKIFLAWNTASNEILCMEIASDESQLVYTPNNPIEITDDHAPGESINLSESEGALRLCFQTVTSGGVDGGDPLSSQDIVCWKSNDGAVWTFEKMLKRIDPNSSGVRIAYERSVCSEQLLVTPNVSDGKYYKIGPDFFEKEWNQTFGNTGKSNCTPSIVCMEQQ